jgi:alcohol dehydrogenase class IV
MPNFVTPKKNNGPSEDGEIVRPAFDDVSGPHVSYNLPFDKAATKHVVETFAADRVYILASGSLCRNTKFVQQLQDALGRRVAGVRKGMTPHTLWSEVLEVVEDCRRVKADLLITIGGGSLTDAAKLVAMVCDAWTLHSLTDK